ncbi:elongation factor 1-beta [Methanobrevibacter sp. DSM 116169]|uniref:elongation factor 1-beta n=1 Tax=Methanobrevibacter sp. DSM 116169 TaxID=3242727 RepID=UPI0038FCF680
MSEVVATMKVMPESVDVDLETLKEEIRSSMPEDAELHKIDEEPIAFGLVALIVMFIIQDAEGGTEPTEEAIGKLPNVGSVEVTNTTRLM